MKTRTKAINRAVNRAREGDMPFVKDTLEKFTQNLSIIAAHLPFFKIFIFYIVETRHSNVVLKMCYSCKKKG